MKKNIENKINEIEREMKNIGLWQNSPLTKSAYDIHEAFGADKISLAQWLQFILIPQVRKKLLTDGPWPSLSQVGIYASQQYLFFRRDPDEKNVLTTQGSLDHKEMKLVHLLIEFDAFFNAEAAVNQDSPRNTF